MNQFSIGAAMTAISVGVIVGYNVNVVTGIFAFTAMVGVAYMIAAQFRCTINAIMKVLVKK